MTLVKTLRKMWQHPPIPTSLSRFDNELSLSKYIPITHLVSPSIFMTRNGELGAVIYIEGCSFIVQDNQELNILQSQLSFALKTLGEHYGIYVTAHRYLKPTHLAGAYPTGFAQDFNTAYSQQFKDSELYVTDLYVTLILRRHGKENSHKSFLNIVKSLLETTVNSEYDKWLDKQLSNFNESITQLLSALTPYSPRLLAEKITDNDIVCPELLSFFSILINGENTDYTYPRKELAQALPRKRLFIGHNTLHFQGNTELDDRFGAILAIKDYCPQTAPGLLDELLKLPCSYIATHSFLGIAKADTLKMIDEQVNRLRSTKDAAVSQLYELEQAKDDLVSNHINFGMYHNTVLVLSKDLNELTELVAKVTDLYRNQKIVAVRETINLENAYWAQIPGNARFIRRSVAISNHNFSCFASLHNYYHGYYNQNHLGSALMLAETPSKTPFYLNLHERSSGRKNDIPKGHTLLIGPSNAGKTVIMTCIDAMMQKYQIRSFLFDRDFGMEIYVRAMQGRYYRLTPEEPTGFNPCQLEDTPKNRDFLRNLIRLLCTDSTTELSSSDISQIAEVVERNYTLSFNKRTLSNISFFFSYEFSGLGALSRWLQIADSTGRSGEYAWVFDNPADTFDTESISTFGFDMTYLLSSKQETKDHLTPVMYYLFHRIENTLGKNRLTGVYLDEGWQLLDNPYWVDKISNYLATWRKANAFVFFATQLPKTVISSPLAAALNSNTATHIYLANPKADASDYLNSLKLTAREFEIISMLKPQSRYFLIKQGRESAIVRINLQGLEKYIRVLSGNLDSVQDCEDLRKTVGDDPVVWLQLFYQMMEHQ